MNWLLFFLYVTFWAFGMLAGREVFLRLWILDRPGKDVPKRDSVPTLQWVTVIWVFVVLIYLTKRQLDLSFGKEFLWLFVWWGLLAVVAVVDELWRIVDRRFSLSAKVRLLLQVVISIWAWWWSGIWLTEVSIPVFWLVELTPVFSLSFTIAWFLLCINALNRSDGVYGLATWNATIWFLTIFLLLTFVVFQEFEFMSYERNELLIRVQVLSLMLTVLWTLATIMEYRPWWLLRDVGVMFFGFSLWYLALLWWAKIGTLVVVMALPLFDAIRVIVDRIRQWVSPFTWSLSHLHHRLLALWWNRHEVRWFIWWWSLFFLVIMILLGVDAVAKMIVFGIMAFLFFWINVYLFWHKWLPSVYGVQNKKWYSEEKTEKIKDKR